MQTEPMQTLFIIPYTTESDYEENVKHILTFLKENIPSENIILTEGDYTKICDRRDVLKYSKEFNLTYCDAITLAQNIKTNIKYIVNIGTWATGIISNDFIINHPHHTVIHIQGPILPSLYRSDKVENLEFYEVSINTLMNNLTS